MTAPTPASARAPASPTAAGRNRLLTRPSGLYVDDKENLYIADTENSRIVVLDREGALVRIVGPPSGTGIPDNFVYKPIAVAADAGGRIYAVSRSSNMGVLSFSMSGEFEGFLGVQPVTFSAMDLFWRTFMTQAQRERSVQNIPVDFNDIDIDADGFLFVTSASIDKTSQYNALLAGSTASDYAPVKRLNPSGDDILRRNGFYPPAGDLDVDPSETLDLSVSAFSGVSVNDLGMYSVLDSTKQRIFTYTADGNLLCAFGGVGSSKGQFLSAAALAYHGEDLAVLDAETGLLTLFRPSDYGQLVHEAIGLQNSRRYDEALKKWEEILPLNANLDTVYMDMGKAYLRSGDYDKAMDYFETIGEREFYSKAFAAKRNDRWGLSSCLSLWRWRPSSSRRRGSSLRSRPSTGRTISTRPPKSASASSCSLPFILCSIPLTASTRSSGTGGAGRRARSSCCSRPPPPISFPRTSRVISFPPL